VELQAEPIRGPEAATGAGEVTPRETPREGPPQDIPEGEQPPAGWEEEVRRL
jgi:hypothetical protein